MVVLNSQSLQNVITGCQVYLDTSGILHINISPQTAQRTALGKFLGPNHKQLLQLDQIAVGEGKLALVVEAKRTAVEARGVAGSASNNGCKR